jgi:hypothetical protein
MDSYQMARLFRENQRKTLEKSLAATMEERGEILGSETGGTSSYDQLRDVDIAIHCMTTGLEAINKLKGGLRIIAGMQNRNTQSHSSSCTACGTDLVASENR